MKKLIISITLCLLCIISYSQEFTLDLNAKMIRNNGVLKKGEQVTLVKFTHESHTDPTKTYADKLIEEFFITTKDGRRVEITSRIDDCFEFEYKNVQDFWDAQIITNVLYMLKDKGFQYKLRREMEEDALEYISRVESYDLVLNDPYLENYIYSVIAKIAPIQLIDGRPGSINVLIQQNPSINACCYPNGTIVLNTGLLSVLHSEDELVAVLAHEIAHFILDHSIQNVNKAAQRQKRAEFWAALATGLTAVAESVAAANNSYYVPGAATFNMAVLSTSIGMQVLERLGMEYNHEQEKEADKLAVKVLEILGYDKNALSTALSRMEKEYIIERNNAMYVNSYTHPALVSRINDSGKPSTEKSKDFEKIVSFAVTDVATMKYQDRRFRQCLPLVNQNIENGVAQSDDYILKANCIMATKNTTDSNLEALALITKAKSINPENINIYKSEIIALLRLNRVHDAISQLESYKTYIDNSREDMKSIESDDTWDFYNKYIAEEKEWVSRMLIKLKGMN